MAPVFAVGGEPICWVEFFICLVRLAEMGDHHRTPLRWHDTEEVLVFLEVDGDGFARVGDEEHKIETQTSVVVPPGTIHAFGLLDGRVLKSVSILRDADAKK